MQGRTINCESTWPGLIDLNGPYQGTIQLYGIYKDHNYEYMCH